MAAIEEVNASREMGSRTTPEAVYLGSHMCDVVYGRDGRSLDRVERFLGPAARGIFQARCLALVQKERVEPTLEAWLAAPWGGDKASYEALLRRRYPEQVRQGGEVVKLQEPPVVPPVPRKVVPKAKAPAPKPVVVLPAPHRFTPVKDDLPLGVVRAS